MPVTELEQCPIRMIRILSLCQCLQQNVSLLIIEMSDNPMSSFHSNSKTKTLAWLPVLPIGLNGFQIVLGNPIPNTYH